MKLTVKDLFNIPILSNFKLIAGSGGLNKPVNFVEILDFEFAQGVSLPRDHIFDGESIALTSLLFAKDDPDLITSAVKSLFDLNVSALAYKPILFKELPKEALDFANANNFPILEFGGDEYFEPIILAINQELAKDNDIAAIERDLIRVVEQDMTPKEEAKLYKKINIKFKNFVRVVSIKDPAHNSDESITALIRKMQGSSKLTEKSAICKYNDNYFVILSQDEPDKQRFRALLEDIMFALQIDNSNLICGVSSIHQISTTFGRAIREAFWARNVAIIEEIPIRFYDEIGIYRLVAPEINNSNVISYMEEYLSPLLHNNEDLLNTACTYIKSKGDLDKTADALYCHKNTIRYRLNKIHELLDPKSNEKEFNENLSIAIRIYLFSQFL